MLQDVTRVLRPTVSRVSINSIFDQFCTRVFHLLVNLFCPRQYVGGEKGMANGSEQCYIQFRPWELFDQITTVRVASCTRSPVKS